MKIYFDGGCRPNPGQMEASIAIEVPGKTTQAYQVDLGYGTNNIAEWSGLVWAVHWMKANGLAKATIIGDSQLVINQARRVWKINDQFLISLFEDFEKMSQGLDLNLLHVLRDSNLAGRYLEFGTVGK